MTDAEYKLLLMSACSSQAEDCKGNAAFAAQAFEQRDYGAAKKYVDFLDSNLQLLKTYMRAIDARTWNMKSFLALMNQPALRIMPPDLQAVEMIAPVAHVEAIIIHGEMPRRKLEHIFALGPDRLAARPALTKRWHVWAVLAEPDWAARYTANPAAKRPHGFTIWL